MDTLTITIQDSRAGRLIQYLADWGLIKVLNTTSEKKEDIAAQFRGKLSAEAADRLHKHVEEMRSEWERNI